jgi:hypothetical protein
MKNLILCGLMQLFLIPSIAQVEDLYSKLLNRGIEEYNNHNYSLARLKWETARDNCPNLDASKQKILNGWIQKSFVKQSAFKKAIETANNKVVVKRDTVVKTQIKRDTIFIDKPIVRTKVIKDTIYIEKPVVKTVIIKDTVEKIVYRVRTEDKQDVGYLPPPAKDKEKMEVRYTPPPARVQEEEQVNYLPPPVQAQEKKWVDYTPPLFGENYYGKGNGKITIGSSCPYYIDVWIDGDYVGRITTHRSNGEVYCNDDFFQVVSAGQHHIYAKTQGYYWETYVTVWEGRCSIKRLNWN